MKKQIIILGLVIGMVTTIQARTLQEAIAACDKGDAQMCMALGDDMKKSNPKEAKKYYEKGLKRVKKSCNENNADACFGLASFYAFGKGVEKNEKKAVSTWKKALALFQKTCKKGDTYSCEQVEHTQAMIDMAQ